MFKFYYYIITNLNLNLNYYINQEKPGFFGGSLDF